MNKSSFNWLNPNKITTQCVIVQFKNSNYYFYKNKTNEISQQQNGEKKKKVARPIKYNKAPK